MIRQRVWKNGRIVPFAEATVSPFAHVVHYGTSVFEGIRAYEEWDEDDQPTGVWNIWMLTEHIERLFRSAAAFRIRVPFTPEELIEATRLVVSLNPGHTYIRPVVYLDHDESGMGIGVDPTRIKTSVAIGTAVWGKYVASFLHHEGASVYVTNRARFSAQVGPGTAKGAPSYGLSSVQAKIDSNEANASEAILVDEHGNPLDGSGMNLLIVQGNGVIVTPDPVKSNILPGLTQRFLLEELELEDACTWHYGTITLSDLLSSAEVFLTGTATEVTPVTLVKYLDPKGQFTENDIGNGHPGPVTLRLSTILRKSVHRQLEPYRRFLTPVPLLENATRR